MKHLKRYLQVLPAALLIVACANEKDPVPDLETMRQKGKVQMDLGPDQPRVIKQEVPVEQPPVVKEKQIERIDDRNIILSLPPVMTFSEGNASTFAIRVRCTVPDCTPTAAIENPPQGVSFVPVASKDPMWTQYDLTWNPGIGTVGDSDDKLKGFEARILAKATAKDPAKNAALSAVTKASSLSLVVYKAQIKVSDVSIEALPAEVQEKQSAQFKVTARIQGLSAQSGKKPTITPKNVVGATVSGGPTEIGGGSFIVVGESSHDGEKWTFNMSFDTTHFAPPRNGETDIARAGFGLQVCMDGVCDDMKTAKVNIRYAKPAPAPAQVDARAPSPAPLAPAPPLTPKSSKKKSTKDTATKITTPASPTDKPVAAKIDDKAPGASTDKAPAGSKAADKAATVPAAPNVTKVPADKAASTTTKKSKTASPSKAKAASNVAASSVSKGN